MKKEIKKFTREWFVEQGRIGGQKTKEIHGLKHFRKLNEDKVDKSKKRNKNPIESTT